MTRSIEALRLLLENADVAYHGNDDPVMSDAEYDALVKEWVTRTQSPWLPIWKTAAYLESQRHPIPMLSLEKANTLAEWSAWLARQSRNIMVMSPKVDGMACELVYDRGRLRVALTRGDGVNGEVITPAASHAQGVPINLPDSVVLDDGLVVQRPNLFALRGEMYLTEADFAFVGGANRRNAVAGLMRRKDAKALSGRHATFVAYRALSVTFPESQTADIPLTVRQTNEALRKFGFNVLPQLPFEADSVLTFNVFEAARRALAAQVGGTLPYDIDGLVVTPDDVTIRQETKDTSHHPQWAVAIKFEAEQRETVLLAVEWSAGRTGQVVPTLVFEAVPLAGTTVNRATGNNVDKLLSLGVGINDVIVVQKANEIIPEVVKVVTEAPNRIPIQVPGDCPACHSKLVKNGPMLRCLSQQCPAKLVGALTFFAQRGNMDIDGLGEKVAEALVARFNANVLGIYLLSEQQLAAMPFPAGSESLYGEVRAGKLHKAIKASASKPWRVVLASLGCPDLGRPEEEAISQRYSLERLLSTHSVQLKHELVALKGIGEKTAVTFANWVNAQRDELLQPLLNLRILNVTPLQEMPKAGPLTGYKIVITGELEGAVSRSDWTKRLEELGATVPGSVSKNTTFLVVGNSGEGTSKHTAALKNGVQCLSESEFLAWVAKTVGTTET